MAGQMQPEALKSLSPANCGTACWMGHRASPIQQAPPGAFRAQGACAGAAAYSHSMVAGGLEEMS